MIQDSLLESFNRGTRAPRFKPYPAYKDSGVESLGNIPASWNTKRLKFVLTQPLKYGANEAAEIDDTDLPRYVRITDIDDDGGLRASTFKSLPFDVAKEYLLREGDLLFARSGATAGKTFLYRTGWGTCAYAGYLIRARLDAKQVCPEFVRYFTTSSNYWQWVSSTFIQATIQNVSAERYASMTLPLPRLREQQGIARFLDIETRKLDRLIAKKERLIELLHEKRTALVTRAVTKGLSPQAPMKDSGIEWLGRIPAHWDVRRVKHVALDLDSGIQMGPFGSMLKDLVFSDTGYKLYGQENTITGDFEKGSRWLSEPQYRDLQAYRLEPGDIIVTRKGSIGNARLVRSDFQPGIIDSDTIRIRVDRDVIDSRFLVLLLHKAAYVREQIESVSRGAVLSGLNTAAIADLVVVVPPRVEQGDLLDGLQRAQLSLDALIDRVRSAIKRLKEFRTAVTAAAVTG